MLLFKIALTGLLYVGSGCAQEYGRRLVDVLQVIDTERWPLSPRCLQCVNHGHDIANRNKSVCLTKITLISADEQTYLHTLCQFSDISANYSWSKQAMRGCSVRVSFDVSRMLTSKFEFF